MSHNREGEFMCGCQVRPAFPSIGHQGGTILLPCQMHSKEPKKADTKEPYGLEWMQ